jgi:septal ring factor EnvC (AmiA/AmiB activator)
MAYGDLELQLQQKRKLLREKEKQRNKLQDEIDKLLKEIKDLEAKMR